MCERCLGAGGRPFCAFGPRARGFRERRRRVSKMRPTKCGMCSLALSRGETSEERAPEPDSRTFPFPRRVPYCSILFHRKKKTGSGSGPSRTRGSPASAASAVAAGRGRLRLFLWSARSSREKPAAGSGPTRAHHRSHAWAAPIAVYLAPQMSHRQTGPPTAALAAGAEASRLAAREAAVAISLRSEDETLATVGPFLPSEMSPAYSPSDALESLLRGTTITGGSPSSVRGRSAERCFVGTAVTASQVRPSSFAHLLSRRRERL